MCGTHRRAARDSARCTLQRPQGIHLRATPVPNACAHVPPFHTVLRASVVCGWCWGQIHRVAGWVTKYSPRRGGPLPTCLCARATVHAPCATTHRKTAAMCAPPRPTLTHTAPTHVLSPTYSPAHALAHARTRILAIYFAEFPLPFNLQTEFRAPVRPIKAN